MVGYQRRGLSQQFLWGMARLQPNPLNEEPKSRYDESKVPIWCLSVNCPEIDFRVSGGQFQAVKIQRFGT